MTATVLPTGDSSWCVVLHDHRNRDYEDVAGPFDDREDAEFMAVRAEEIANE